MSQDHKYSSSSMKDQRLKSPTSSRDLADCTFVIDDQEIKAHKFILSWCSPVFEKMFYGKMASNRVVITDISLEDFTHMLEFVYTDSVSIKSVLHAWSLFYIAHKYLLNDFAEVCTSYIQNNLTINNLILNYEFAEMFGIEELQKVCLGDIADYVRGIFQQNCDYHMKPSSLCTILEQHALNISNCDLLEGVLRWAVCECNIKNIYLSPKNIINVLSSSKILQHLVNVDFNISSNFDNLLQDSCELIKDLRNTNAPHKTYLQKHWCVFCKCRQTYKIAGRIELRSRDVLISNLSVNRNILLYGLVIVTEDEQIDSKSKSYNGSIRIQISELGNSQLLFVTIFSGYLPYETPIYVPLTDLVYLKCDMVYSIKIYYTNLDNFNGIGIRKSSVLCNYMSNKLVDEKKKTIFSFEEMDGSVVRGVCYYPV